MGKFRELALQVVGTTGARVLAADEHADGNLNTESDYLAIYQTKESALMMVALMQDFYGLSTFGDAEEILRHIGFMSTVCDKFKVSKPALWALYQREPAILEAAVTRAELIANNEIIPEEDEDSYPEESD